MNTIENTCFALTRQQGRRRNLLLFALGVCATLAMPPVYLFPLLIPAFTGLFFMIESAPSRKRAFWDGWWWGYGYYLTGLYWICISMLTDPAKFGWMVPFALFGLPAVIAVFPAIACLLFTCLRGAVASYERKPCDLLSAVASLLLFTCSYSLLEYARGHVLTGFPWNLPGYAWMVSDVSAQVASVTGIYGLSLITVLLASAPALLLHRRGARVVVVLWAAFALSIAGGAWRLAEADKVPPEARFVSGVKLRLVQPNIAQPHKWDPARQQEILKRQIDLSLSGDVSGITHTIWPETAVPYLIVAHSELAHALAKAVPLEGALVVGALRVENPESPDWKVWNSLIALGADGGFASVYDKRHLVPFGEFMPLRSLIPVAAEKLIVGAKDFSDGSKTALFPVPGAPPATALICYEAIFPQSAMQSGGERAQWLINVTNDAWFGVSSGPYQHLAMSRMRAIEQGVPLVRVANTGISVVTDAYGRILQKMPLNHTGVLDTPLPKAIGDTTYSILGDLIFQLLIVVCGLLGAVLNKRLGFN